MRVLERIEYHDGETPLTGWLARPVGLVRAAVAAGWFTDATDPDAVGDMRPGEAREWSKKVNAAYIEAIKTDPN